MKLVKCPICGMIKKVYASQRFFRCCHTLFDIEKYKVGEGETLRQKKALKGKIETPPESDEIEVELV
jgi:hypothetical protein